MPSSAAACTSGSITRQWTASTRSSWPACRRSPRSWPARSARSSAGFGTPTSSSCPGSLRRWTGLARPSPLARGNSARRPSRRHSVAWVSIRRISDGCAARARGSSSPGPSMPDPGTVLTRNWLHFGRVLRGLGFDAGPVRMLAFLTTLTVIDLGRGDDLRTAVHAHFGRRRDELPILDQALAAFLGARAPAGDASASSQTAVRERGAVMSLTARQLKVLDDEEGAEGAEEQKVASYSRAELLRQKDFDALTEAEMAEVRRLIRLMRLPAGLTRSRRARAGGRDRLGIRRLLRRSLRFGGELLGFSWKSPTGQI